MSITQQTRRESWEKTQDVLGDRHKSVLSAVKSSPNGLTPWEVADKIGLHVYMVRPRMTELAGMGYLSVVGTKHQPKTNRNESVYRVPEPIYPHVKNGQMYFV